MIKKILITGKNSYVGSKVGQYLSEHGFHVDYLSLRDQTWKNHDFSGYEYIFHVAGIAHVPHSKKNDTLYHQVNTKLTKELALKAKEVGVNQFIFMSSIMVYGDKATRITQDTLPNPTNSYGLSKLNAEKELFKLKSPDFNVSIIRAPMIYGLESKGNYPRLRKLALKIPIFPKINNQRSMLYIDNLSMFVEHIINNSYKDVYMPHNQKHSNTPQLVEWIRAAHEKRTILTRVTNPLIYLLKYFMMPLEKLFRSFYYDFDDDVLESFMSLKESVEWIEKSNET